MAEQLDLFGRKERQGEEEHDTMSDKSTSDKINILFSRIDSNLELALHLLTRTK